VACGYLVHPRAHILSWATAALLAAGIVWPWLSVAGVSGSLDFLQTRVREGEPATLRLTLQNRWPWRVCGLGVRVPAGRNSPQDQDVGAVRLLHGRSTQSIELKLVLPRRGEYPGGDALITCGFPFGLCLASRRLRVLRRLVVWPRTWAVAAMPSALGGIEDGGLCTMNKAGSHGDILAVRPYRRGDSLRRVHWPQTARHDRLIVCERQASSHLRTTVVLDALPDHHTGAGPFCTFERAIRVAASLCRSWLDAGANVGLIAGNCVIPPEGGPAHTQRILDALAKLPVEGVITSVHPDLEWSSIFVTTDRAPWKTPLQSLKRRHLVMASNQTHADAVCDLADARQVEEAMNAWR
jgi:uncharacterized protein (DUF58 family)